MVVGRRQGLCLLCYRAIPPGTRSPTSAMTTITTITRSTIAVRSHGGPVGAVSLPRPPPPSLPPPRQPPPVQSLEGGNRRSGLHGPVIRCLWTVCRYCSKRRRGGVLGRRRRRVFWDLRGYGVCVWSSDNTQSKRVCSIIAWCLRAVSPPQAHKRLLRSHSPFPPLLPPPTTTITIHRAAKLPHASQENPITETSHQRNRAAPNLRFIVFGFRCSVVPVVRRWSA